MDEFPTPEQMLQFLIDWLDNRGDLEDHCFTFPDGTAVWATGKAPWTTKPSTD